MPENFERQNQEENLPEEKRDVQEKSELIFRDLRIEDCDDMVKAINSVVGEGASIQRKEKTTREEWLPILQNILERTRSGQDICVAAEKNGHIVGWLGGKLMEGKTDMPTAEVFTAILSKEGRGGLKNFLDLAESWLERAQKEWKIKKVVTETSLENRALKLYKFIGFVESGPAEKEGYVKLEKNLE